MKFDALLTIENFFHEFLSGQKDNLLAWVAVFVGMGSAIYFGCEDEPSFSAIVSLLMGSMAFFICIFRLYQQKTHSLSLLLLLIVSSIGLAVMGGCSAAQFKTDVVHTAMIERETRPVMIEATLDHLEEQEGKKGTLLFLSDVAIEKWGAEETPSKIRITIKKKVDAVAGDRVKLLAKLTPISGPVAPGSYDFARHYYFESIGALGFALSDITILQKADGGFFNLEVIRSAISQKIHAVVPEREAGIAAALMTGERAAITDEDWDALRASGLAHIISISGLHVAMVAAPVFFIVRLFLALIPFVALRLPIKKIAAFVALVTCSLYVGLVVPSVPTTRALLMTGVALIAIMLDRSPFSMRLVALSAILVLLVSPESIWSVSFQMSFGAVAALVAMAEALRPYLITAYADAGWIKKAGIYIGGIFMTSLVASIATAPYSLYHFQQVASYSVLANALSVPISGLMIMPMVIVSFVLMPFGVADWSLKILGLGVDWLLDIARWTENLPGAVLTSSAMPDLFLIMMTIAGILVILLHGRQRIVAFIPLIIAIISIGFHTSPDVIVSGDGAVMAVKDDRHVYVSSLRKDKFAVETWMKRWNIDKDEAYAFPRQGQTTLENGGVISCDPSACRITLNGTNISYGRKYYEIQQDCAWADIVVSEARLTRGFCGDGEARAIGYYDFLNKGAMAITLGNPLFISQVGDEREDRPWTIQTDYKDRIKDKFTRNKGE